MKPTTSDPAAWLKQRETAARRRAREHAGQALRAAQQLITPPAVAGAARCRSNEIVAPVRKHPLAALGLASATGFLLAPRRKLSDSSKARQAGTVPQLLSTSHLLLLVRVFDSVRSLATHLGSVAPGPAPATPPTPAPEQELPEFD